MTSKYFTDAEMRRCMPPCSLDDMTQTALDKFDKARELAGIPFVITSAYRSKSYDLDKGRTGEGAHTTGEAFDIKCDNSINRFKIITALLAVGCNRIGIGDTFIHADFSERLTNNVIWTY